MNIEKNKEENLAPKQRRGMMNPIIMLGAGIVLGIVLLYSFTAVGALIGTQFRAVALTICEGNESCVAVQTIDYGLDALLVIGQFLPIVGVIGIATVSLLFLVVYLGGMVMGGGKGRRVA